MDIKEKIKQLENRVGELEKDMQALGFWQDKDKAVEVQKEYSALKEKLELVKNTKTNQEKSRILFAGKYDNAGAVITIAAGAGGRDAQDWATLLHKMYARYFENKGWQTTILYQAFGEGGGPEGRIGLKEIIIQVKNKGSYGLLKNETGAHRLVRISPFSAKDLRHTSFAKVEVLPQIEEKDSQLEIKAEDLKVDTFRASGHGGQNVNKRETAIRITHLPTGIVVNSQSQRQQDQNKKTALGVLRAKLTILEEENKQQEISQVKGKGVDADFGHQIRSYVLHPYKMVKDLRTGVETSNVDKVMNGDLDEFIQAEINLNNIND